MFIQPGDGRVEAPSIGWMGWSWLNTRHVPSFTSKDADVKQLIINEYQLSGNNASINPLLPHRSSAAGSQRTLHVSHPRPAQSVECSTEVPAFRHPGNHVAHRQVQSQDSFSQLLPPCDTTQMSPTSFSQQLLFRSIFTPLAPGTGIHHGVLAARKFDTPPILEVDEEEDEEEGIYDHPPATYRSQIHHAQQTPRSHNGSIDCLSSRSHYVSEELLTAGTMVNPLKSGNEVNDAANVTQSEKKERVKNPIRRMCIPRSPLLDRGLNGTDKSKLPKSSDPSPWATPTTPSTTPTTPSDTTCPSDRLPSAPLAAPSATVTTTTIVQIVKRHDEPVVKSKNNKPPSQPSAVTGALGDTKKVSGNLASGTPRKGAKAAGLPVESECSESFHRGTPLAEERKHITEVHAAPESRTHNVKPGASLLNSPLTGIGYPFNWGSFGFRQHPSLIRGTSSISSGFGSDLTRCDSAIPEDCRLVEHNPQTLRPSSVILSTPLPSSPLSSYVPGFFGSPQFLARRWFEPATVRLGMPQTAGASHVRERSVLQPCDSPSLSAFVPAPSPPPYEQARTDCHWSEPKLVQPSRTISQQDTKPESSSIFTATRSLERTRLGPRRPRPSSDSSPACSAPPPVANETTATAPSSLPVPRGPPSTRFCPSASLSSTLVRAACPDPGTFPAAFGSQVNPLVAGHVREVRDHHSLVQDGSYIRVSSSVAPRPLIIREGSQMPSSQTFYAHSSGNSFSNRLAPEQVQVNQLRSVSDQVPRVVQTFSNSRELRQTPHVALPPASATMQFGQRREAVPVGMSFPGAAINGGQPYMAGNRPSGQFVPFRPASNPLYTGLAASNSRQPPSSVRI